MTPQEFRAARDAFGLSANEMADLLGTQSRRDDRGRTVRRWESGEADVPPHVEIIIRLCERSQANLDFAWTLARGLADQRRDGAGT
ncbi:MAG: hypothetical protein Q7S99_03060 [Parvibaculum sp.]|nr:hypothetical protein [Parvibaculum sp.]